MDAAPAMIDVAFEVQGRELPRDHRWLLAEALLHELSWLAAEPAAAVQPLKLVPGAADPGLVSPRSRLVLRVPRGRAADLDTLAGRTLELGGHTLYLGRPQRRELLPHVTLYAHFVDAAGADEAAFLAAASAELAALDVAGDAIVGRAQRVRGPEGPLAGFSLMLHGLRGAASQRLLERGLGRHRLLGCGVFVPHKSAAAVAA